MDAAFTVGDLVQMRTAQLSGNMAGTQMGDGLDGIFAALFAQMMGDTSSLQSQNADELIAGILDGQGTKKDEPNVQAMELLAGSLFGLQTINPELMQQYEELVQSMQSVSAGGMGGMDMASLVQYVLMQQASSPESAQMLADAFDQARADTFADRLTDVDAEWDAYFSELVPEGTAPTLETRAMKTEADALMEQMRAQSAVRSVRETLGTKQNAGGEKTQPLDIEALQQAVNNRQYAVDPAAQREQTADINNIAEQLKTGILDNVKQGKNEFTVRLKPEGMGEIMVKFTEEKNEIALRIVTTSASVGRMIANDVAVLQNALRPLRAQVQEIVTVQPADQSYAAGAALADDQAGRQQFAWQNNDGQQSGTSSRSRRNRGNGFEAAIDAVDEVQEAPDDTNVNLLI